MAVLLLQDVLDELLGSGLPAPEDAIARAGFVADAPWSWCCACGRSLPGSAPRSAGPARCGRSACRADAIEGAPECVVRLGSHAGPLRSWVVDLKHAAWQAMGESLGIRLARQLEASRVVAAADRGTVVVPVPSPWIRTHARGIDHADSIARTVARALRIRRIRALRQRLGGTQVDANARRDRLSRSDRFVARAGARPWIAGQHVIAIDDVRTTGATLAEVARAVRAMGAVRVTAAVLSVRE